MLLKSMPASSHAAVAFNSLWEALNTKPWHVYFCSEMYAARFLDTTSNGSTYAIYEYDVFTAWVNIWENAFCL
jgi:hypothetical protein